MPMGYDFISLKIEGLAELTQELTQLPRELQGTILGGGLKAAAQVIRDQARIYAAYSRDTGLTEKSIVSYRMRGSRPNDMTYQVAVTMKKKGYPGRKIRGKARVRQAVGKKRSAYYWRFVEFGTVKMAAQPFLRPGFDNAVGTALGHFEKIVQRGISMAVAKMTMIREGR